MNTMAEAEHTALARIALIAAGLICSIKAQKMKLMINKTDHKTVFNQLNLLISFLD